MLPAPLPSIRTAAFVLGHSLTLQYFSSILPGRPSVLPARPKFVENDWKPRDSHIMKTRMLDYNVPFEAMPINADREFAGRRKPDDAKDKTE
jgi:hypothetical protein